MSPPREWLCKTAALHWPKEQPQDFETVREISKETVGKVNWSYVDRDPEKGLRFDLLICVWLASKKKACLFTASGPVVEEVEDFDMRGTGADIARYAVSMSGFSSAMHMAKVANIARTALAAAKSFDAWCGGQSTLTGIRHSDGELWGQALHYQDDPTEAFINGFWRHCGVMLTDLVSPKLSGKAIDELVNELRSDIKRLHSQWAARQKTAIYSARIIAIGDDPADAPSPRSTKADQ